MQSLTKPTKVSEIQRQWHLIDVDGQILGRVAGKIAHLLMGKSKPYFAKNMDCGDNVVVINAKSVKVTGKKEEQKVYTNYSGYPGGLRKRTLKELRNTKPEEIVFHSVAGMLPKNKLKDRMLSRLKIFSGTEQPYGDRLNVQG